MVLTNVDTPEPQDAALTNTRVVLLNLWDRHMRLLRPFVLVIRIHVEEENNSDLAKEDQFSFPDSERHGGIDPT